MKGYLRAVTKADMDLLFQWANEPLVRQNSFSTKEISYEDHKKWFENLMMAEDCRQYIYVYENEDIGQVRIKVNGEIAEISYSICAQKRGQGHGKMILQFICEQVKNEFPMVQKLTGQVKPDNIASQAAFKDVGFEEKCYVYELTFNKFVKKEYSENVGEGIIPNQ